MSDVPIFYNLQTAGDVTAITGRLSDLETTVNTNLVAAINEISGKFPVSVPNGGTGQTSLTSGDILLGNGTSGIDSVSTLPISKGGTGGGTATAARTNLGVRTAEQLYYNVNGSAGTIKLSSNIGNYDIIQIFYWSYHSASKWLDSKTVYNNQVSTISTALNATFSTTYGTNKKRIKLYSHNIFINDDTVTWGYAYTANLTDTESSVVDTESDTFKISRILGYKY